MGYRQKATNVWGAGLKLNDFYHNFKTVALSFKKKPIRLISAKEVDYKSHKLYNNKHYAKELTMSKIKKYTPRCPKLHAISLLDFEEVLWGIEYLQFPNSEIKQMITEFFYKIQTEAPHLTLPEIEFCLGLFEYYSNRFGKAPYNLN